MYKVINNKTLFLLSTLNFTLFPIADFDQVFASWAPTIEVVLTTENKVHSDYNLCPITTHNHT